MVTSFKSNSLLLCANAIWCPIRRRFILVCLSLVNAGIFLWPRKTLFDFEIARLQSRVFRVWPLQLPPFSLSMEVAFCREAVLPNFKSSLISYL